MTETSLAAFISLWCGGRGHEGRTEDELEAEAAGMYRLAASRGRAPVAVRAFTPTAEADGYETGVSALENTAEDVPFLVDSVSALLEARGLAVARMVHPIAGIARDASGAITGVGHPARVGERESLMHVDLHRRLAPEELAALEDDVRSVLADVRRAVDGFVPIAAKVAEAAGWTGDPEAAAFLRWLLDEDAVLLGWQELDAQGAVVPGSGLGILDAAGPPRAAAPQAPLGPRGLAISRIPERSTVHRREHLEEVRIARPDGGEGRLLMLLTARGHFAPASRVPILASELEGILAREDLIAGTHDYKAAVRAFDAFPKIEMLASGPEAILRALDALLEVHGGDGVRLVGGPSGSTLPAGACRAWLMAALPRDRATPAFRDALRTLVAGAYRTTDVEVTEVLDENDRVQLHLAVQAPAGQTLPEVDLDRLEREAVALARTWRDAVADALTAAHGAERAGVLAARWLARFPEAYQAAVVPALAAEDVAGLERLLATGETIVVAVHDDADRTRVVLYRRGPKVELAQATRVLEDLGLRVIEEVPFQLHGDGDDWIQAFGVLGPADEPLGPAESGHVAVALEAVLRGDAESDALNRLVVSAGLDTAQLGILRAYRRYRQRIGSRFTEAFQHDVIASHPEVARKLLALFELRFGADAAGGPAAPRDEAAEAALHAEIEADLDAITSLDADRILRNQLGLIDATVRTNAYRPGRGALAFKLRGADIPAAPQPTPLWEVYVHSPDVEGVHLRGGRIARGGLRWSDRMDYRTEVYGLMRAQVVKNAVIVPAGAKGGFYLRRPPADPGALREEVRRRYVEYIEALLDVTDDREADGTVVHPTGVRVLDGDDPYLVVAADKGTATFSDTANEVALRRGFWLGDAFASGGSAGYDHKALGITARGAWESVKRHFRALGLDPAVDPFTAVGIGDMSGDVFGNGMLLSDRVKLVAAYDHRHVFLDPDPADPAASHAERRRLFELGRSSWDDYDRGLISEGGGVFPRTAKSVPLSPQVRAALGVEDTELPPTELIRAVLRAPVDLLFNGGIGTVVKASTESDADAQDRGSDLIRIDGRDLRCRVVGEGGNLGFTQRARVEAAHHGVLLHADFIDNSAGVDCSDHEVNLKVLLDLAVRRGDLPAEERDDLLRSVTGHVTEHVLYDSFLQAQILAQEVRDVADRLHAYEDLMLLLERSTEFDRTIDGLPASEEMAERRRSGEGLVLPELSVLLAHAKLWLTDELLGSPLLDDPSLEAELTRYFPTPVVERFGHLLPEHPLRRELLATLAANDCVNTLGPTWVPGVVAELGAEPGAAVRAYRIAVDVAGARDRWDAIEALDVAPEVVWELMGGVDALVVGLARWQLLHNPGGEIDEAVAAQRAAVEELVALLPVIRSDDRRGEDRAGIVALTARGVPEAIAVAHVHCRALVHGPDVALLVARTGCEVEQVARVLLALGEQLRLDWLERATLELRPSTRLQRWADQALRDELLANRRLLAGRVLDERGELPAEEAVDRYLAERPMALKRLNGFFRAMSSEGAADLAGLGLAVRQLRALAA